MGNLCTNDERAAEVVEEIFYDPSDEVDLSSLSGVVDEHQIKWINYLGSVMWPNVRCAMMKKADKIFREKMGDELARHPDVALTHLVLSFDPGNKPPTLERMRIYQRSQQERKALQVDVDFDWKPDESFNVSFAIKGKAKGVHIDRNIGIIELTISGTMSCLMAPLMDVEPCVGTGQMFFLDTPSVAFKLVGVKEMGIFGRMLTSIMQHVVSNVLAEGYILPHRFLQKVRKDLALDTLTTMKSPLPLGLLRVEVLEAKGLPAADTSFTGKKTSDPYVCVKVGFDAVRTTTLDNTLDPVWNDPPGHLFVYNVAQLVRITVHDDDAFGTEELGSVSGYCVYELCKMMVGKTDGLWLDIQDAERKPAGKLKIKLRYFDIADFAPIQATPRTSIEERPYLLTVRLLGMECIQPDRGDMRGAQVTVEIVDPDPEENHNTKRNAHRHLKTGLQKGMDLVHKVRAATGIGFGSRQDGIPRTRKTGKAISWAKQTQFIEGVFKQPISPMVVRAMEKLHMEGLSSKEIGTIFQVPAENVEKAVAMRGNFEAVWHEAVHFLQPGRDPFYGKLIVSVTAPKNMVRGASDGFIGDFEIDLRTALAHVVDNCQCAFRRELHRAKKKGQKVEEPKEPKVKQQNSKTTKSSEAESPGKTQDKDEAQADAKEKSRTSNISHISSQLSDERNHDSLFYEGSGILLEFVVEVRGVDPAACELDDGQTLRSREDILANTTASGVKISIG